LGQTEKLRLTIAYGEPDEDGWIVARVEGVPGAISQGRTRLEARRNVVDALRLVLMLDEEEAPNGRSHIERLDLELRR
jgi:predicted RNase H-like HicB family nuclease